MSAEIIPFKRAARENQRYGTGPCVCLGCRHAWTGVLEVPATANLECPACGLPKGTLKYPFGAGEGDEVLVCKHCDSEALTAFRRRGLNYVLCMSCGADLTTSFYA